ncbi:MAG: hypothetical protein IPP44_00720 [Ideonella sp.]|nr:hypothetical protein [Ideonella sp.]
MKAATISKPRKAGNLGRYVTVLAFLAGLGALCGGAPMAVFGPLLGALGLLVLVLALALFNPAARRAHGFSAISGAVAGGFAMLLPFTVLAAVTSWWLHWDVAQAFASAGLMAAGAATGSEMVKLGGGRFAGSVVPMLGALALSLAWMLLTGWLAAVIR